MSNLKIINRINQIILEKMQTGKVPWRKEWEDNGLPEIAVNAITKKPYTGVNFFLLNMELEEGQSPYFATFKQIQQLGGKLKKGSKGQTIIFWKILEKGKAAEESEAEEKTQIPVLKKYFVFNLNCVELPPEVQARFRPKPQPLRTPSEAEQFKIKRVNEFLEQIKDKPIIEIKNQNRAVYKPKQDLILMPEMAQFTSIDAYYQTLFHELGHSTGHQKRLNRKEVVEKVCFDSMDYSKEELVAELTSSYLASYCGTNCDFDNSAAYIKGWSEQIQNDPHFFITACGKAQKAFDYLTNQNQETEEKKDK
jgi:antirestriction protein ArdC